MFSGGPMRYQKVRRGSAKCASRLGAEFERPDERMWTPFKPSGRRVARHIPPLSCVCAGTPRVYRTRAPPRGHRTERGGRRRRWHAAASPTRQRSSLSQAHRVPGLSSSAAVWPARWLWPRAPRPNEEGRREAAMMPRGIAASRCGAVAIGLWAVSAAAAIAGLACVVRRGKRARAWRGRGWPCIG